MRFLKAVIFGTIIVLLGYYIFRKRDSHKRCSAPNSALNEWSDPNDGLDADDPLTDTVGSEQEHPEAKAASPEPVTTPMSSETLTLSNIPHTPSLFQETDKTGQPAKRVLEVEEDLGVNEQIDDTDSPVVNLFESQSEVEPSQHPGRRVQTGENYPSDRDTLSKARLRCRDNGGEWVLYLQIPDEREVVNVRHNGEQLIHDKEIEIQQFTGQIIVDYEDGGRELVDLPNSTPLYFRTDDEWEQDGTLARSHSKGYFIVIAPVNLDDEFTASEEHEPEECIDPDFNAHFLAIDAYTSSQSHGQYPMTLTGEVIRDLAEPDEHGELYIGTPPELSVPEIVAKARIVEEAGNIRENRWGKNFDPHSQTIASVLNGLDGRFTVRTYLKGSRRRHESRTFRYFKSLKRITLDGETYDPAMILTPDENNRYSDAQLKFEELSGFIKPVSFDNPSVSISDDGLVAIPAAPSIKSVACEFVNRAIITVEIPRVWSRLRDDDSHGEWNDIKPISRDDYRRIAGKGARIEMLLPHSVEAIRVGFGETLEHRVRKVQDSAVIYLRDLTDDAALESIPPGSTTYLSVQIDELVLRLMNVGVPQVKKPSPKDTKSLLVRPREWVEIKPGTLHSICTREGHHWVYYTHEPGELVKAVNNAEGECRRCNAQGRTR